MAEQRHREKETDLQQRSMHVGSLFVAISEEPVILDESVEQDLGLGDDDIL